MDPTENDPLQFLGPPDHFDALVRCGGTLIGEVNGMRATIVLPKNWRMEFESSAGGYLVDERGTERALFMDMGESTYSLAMLPAIDVPRAELDENADNGIFTLLVTDPKGDILYSASSSEATLGNEDAARAEARAMAEAWLDEHYPKWRDLTAYWE